MIIIVERMKRKKGMVRGVKDADVRVTKSTMLVTAHMMLMWKMMMMWKMMSHIAVHVGQCMLYIC